MLTYSINWPAEVHQTARWLAKSTWEGIVEVQDVDLSHKFWGTLTRSAYSFHYHLDLGKVLFQVLGLEKILPVQFSYYVDIYL
jgi:hypothetical protein